MQTPSRRRFISGVAVASPALFAAAKAEAGGHRGRVACNNECAPSPCEQDLLGCNSSQIEHLVEWSPYYVAVPCPVATGIDTARLDFVDRRTGLIRGTLTARKVKNHIFYNNGYLYVFGHILQHTLHPHPGVAYVWLTINGDRWPIRPPGKVVCYEYPTSEPAPAPKAAGVRTDVQLMVGCPVDDPLPCYTETIHYQSISVPYTKPSGTDLHTVKLEFVDRGTTHLVRGEVANTTNFIYIDGNPGTLLVDGTITQRNSFGNPGAVDISITINDTDVVPKAQGACYKYLPPSP